MCGTFFGTNTSVEPPGVGAVPPNQFADCVQSVLDVPTQTEAPLGMTSTLNVCGDPIRPADVAVTTHESGAVVDNDKPLNAASPPLVAMLAEPVHGAEAEN